MINYFRFTTLVSLFSISSLALAGGPLVLEGSDGNTPVTYQNPNVTIHAETGPLGANYNNDEADTLIREAFAFWNDVDSATVKLTLNEGLIAVDIDISNFLDFLPDPNGGVTNADDNLNPIVYDNDGTIIDEFFGVGASLSTIGFAASFFSNEGDFFIEGYAVLNGEIPLSPTDFKLLIAHEIGHFLGLDHSQVNIDNNETDFGSPSICTTTSLSNYPVMYPFVCRDEETLHADDISAISALYPAANFDTRFGIIEGRFVDNDGDPILGANIWAENTATGDVVSIVSDYLLEGTGFYRLHLTPGTYTLHANSINPLFNGGSSIGPYSLSVSGRSFTDPHPIADVTLQAEVAGVEMISIIADQTVTLNLSVAGNSVELGKSSGGGGGSGGGSGSGSGSGSGTISSLVSLLLLSLLVVVRRFNTTKN